MTKAIRIHKTGGPDVMQWEDVEVPAPKEGEARIKHTAVGLNYIDTYHRSGLYPVPMPAIIGSEGAGVVEAVGPGVTDLKAGDRVAYGNAPIGAYAESRIIPAGRLVKLPAGITDQQAASMMLKGMTSQYLIRRTYVVKKGDTILVHAAAGGVGLIICQWAKHLGAHGDRHGRQPGQGEARGGAWRRPHDPLSRHGFRGEGQGNHQGGWRAGGL